MSLREREKIQEVLRGVSDGEEDYSPGKKIRIAGIQFSATGDRKKNIQRALSFADVASDKGADIICFSELFSLPWFLGAEDSYAEQAETLPGPSTEPFIKMAEQFKNIILCPVFEKSDERNFNSVAVIDAHGITGIYRKIQVPDMPFWEERKFFSDGNLGYPVFDTPKCKIGVQIGWDNMFPEGFRLLALQDADLVFSPTAAAYDSHFRWQTMISANSIANNLFIFRVNRVGKEGDLTFYGKSFCVDPFGEMAVKPAFHRDAVVIADIDIGAVKIARKEFPFIQERRTEFYSPLVQDADTE